MGKPVNAESL